MGYTPPPMTFPEAIFSFVAGDGDPNVGLQKRLYQRLAAYIRCVDACVCRGEFICSLTWTCLLISLSHPSGLCHSPSRASSQIVSSIPPILSSPLPFKHSHERQKSPRSCIESLNRSRGGVVTAEEIVPFLPDPAAASRALDGDGPSGLRDEGAVLEAVTR